jgi:hypothetical protein
MDLTRKEQIKALEEFDALYQNRPIKDNAGGMNSTHMFHVWFVAKWLNLPNIIESGIWKGQSTWLLEQACPDAQIWSIDPALYLREYVSPSVLYFSQDFTVIDWWQRLLAKDTLVFFDDHYGVDRLYQAYEKGFKHIIYEDNYHDERGNTFHPSGQALSPKATLRCNNDNSDALKSIIAKYEELPPIFFNNTAHRSAEWAGITWDEYKQITPPALLPDAQQHKYSTFYAERSDYTWIAYIELK